MTPPTQVASAEWATRPERSSMAVLRFMVWLSLFLGRRLSRVVLYPIAAYFVVFAPKAKRASKAYLSRALGRTARLPDGFRHVLTFASVVHDRVYWLRERHDLFAIEVIGESHLAALRQQGRGMVFAGGHFGSFEALRVVGERHGIDTRMLMFPDNARKVTAALTSINPALANSVIALGRPDSVLRVRDHLQNGGSVGILADRMLGEDKSRDIPFLGEPAPFPVGPWRLAAMLAAPVVFMAGCYLGGNRYQLVFEPIIDFAQVPAEKRASAMQEAQDRFVELLEARCRQAPWNWFNFYDFWHAQT